MQASSKPSPLAQRRQPLSESIRQEALSPEQSASASSGAYFRAVRPTALEATALAAGAPVIDCAKVEGLRFELDVGIWRGDAERIARRIVDDAESARDAADDE